MLFMVSERWSSDSGWSLVQFLVFPLVVYYTMALVVPLVNSGPREGFLEHSLFVLIVPILLLMPLAGWKLLRSRRLT